METSQESTADDWCRTYRDQLRHKCKICLSHQKMTGSIASYVLLLILAVLACLPICRSQILDQLDYRLLEESPPDMFVANISRDAKFSSRYTLEDIPNLQFSLMAQPGAGGFAHDTFFTLEKQYGILRIAKEIDRDIICETSIHCKISFKILVQPHQFFHIIKVSVLILDRNDHSPVFPQDIVSLTVAETRNPGAPFPLPLADDTDSREFGVHHYELDPPSDTFSLRTTNSSGVISDLHLILTKKLDHEDQWFYRLKIIAIDGGSPPQSGTAFIEITVLDTNDNNPTFDKTEYEIRVPEDIPINVIILQVHAVDPDEGINGDILYSFSSSTETEYGRIFGIRDKSGEIYLKQSIDYEHHAVYQLTVMAKDQGDNPLPAYTKVKIVVEDVNDNNPEIVMNSLSNSGNAQVLEGMAVDTFVAHLMVSDPDQGDNGRTYCSMASTNFHLNDINGDGTEYYILTTKVFDREVLDKYEVTVSCSDSGVPPRSVTKRIPVTVQDANDHIPVFWRSQYTMKIEENNDLDMFIIKVNATDEDIGGNAAIKYELVNGEDKKLLHVDPITGKITTKVAFDYEKQTEYSFVLIGYDQGYPSHTATTTLKLTITDQNDIAPSFLNKTYMFHILENEPAGSVLGFVEATDADSKEEFSIITYLWDPAILQPIPFSIDPKTGEVTTKNVLNREEKEEYRLLAIAANEGFPGMSSSVIILITILDVNDNAPTILFPSEFNNTIQVAKDTKVGKVIAQIEAHDLDRDQNSRLGYFMDGGNNTFEIDHRTGKVTLANDLELLGHEVCKLVIKVQDQGIPARVSVADLNIMIKKAVAPAQPRNSMSGIFSGYRLIIFLIVVAFIIIVIIIIGIIFTVRRKSGPKKDKKKILSESEKQEEVNSNSRVDNKYIIDDEDDYHEKRPNGDIVGMIDGRSDRPKKEVKFVMDMGCIGESSTDNSQLPWPSPELDNGLIEVRRDTFLLPYLLSLKSNLFPVSNLNLDKCYINCNLSPVRGHQIKFIIEVNLLSLIQKR